MTHDQRIPLCQAEFLQDISIELGRRFTPARHPWRSFSVEADTCEHQGDHLERLTIWATTWYGTDVNLTLWADRTVWISVTLRPAANSGEYRVGFYPQCDGFTAASIAEAFRDTVSVSTRLCYGESPAPVLRRIWKHKGRVQTKGSLGKPPSARLDTP